MRGVEEEYSEYLRGKRVCLVGPSGHIEDLNQRDIIESYDVVVRLNRSWPVPETLQICSGVRTDVLYTCLKVGCRPVKSLVKTREFKENVNFLVFPFPNSLPFSRDITQFNRENRYKIPFIFFDSAEYQKMGGIIKTIPNTGTSAIVHLLLQPIKELYITGVSFLQERYVKGYRSHRPITGRHNQLDQINYVREYCWGDSRVTADEVFSNIMMRGEG